MCIFLNTFKSPITKKIHVCTNEVGQQNLQQFAYLSEQFSKFERHYWLKMLGCTNSLSLWCVQMPCTYIKNGKFHVSWLAKTMSCYFTPMNSYTRAWLYFAKVTFLTSWQIFYEFHNLWLKKRWQNINSRIYIYIYVHRVPECFLHL